MLPRKYPSLDILAEMNKESFVEDITNVKQFALGSMRQARQFRASKMGIFLLKISNKPNPCGLSFQYIL